MPHVPGPPRPEPVEVVDVGSRPVPFLKPFEWVATALRTFRERPLPSTYTTESRPTFDIFGTSRLPEYTVEIVLGGVGNIEVTGSRTPTDKWRQYLSASVSHDDGTPGFARFLTFMRVVQEPTLGFPVLPFEESRVALFAADVFAVRNVSVPPDGRIGVSIPSIGAGAQMTLRTLFVEYSIGEPYGAIS